MREISQEQLQSRIRAENPWWRGEGIGAEFERLTPRAYFDLFFPLVTELTVRRAVVLMGPRRVGKTVLIHHAIRELLSRGVEPRQIVYVSVDHPLYNDLGLEALVDLYRVAAGADDGKTAYVFFDEVQYLKGWEVHLKALVDRERAVRFTVSGSAAAALSLKSQESGAGRFTDFFLPPLTFYEYLELMGQGGLVRKTEVSGRPLFEAEDLSRLNDHFLHFLNFGGYPEVVFSEAIQANPSRFIKSDIIDKVLLRDLPSLYGIGDVQELNKLFTTLAFNTADELSLQDLSTNSGVAKNTIKRYIEYLEAAFLIRVVHRIDESARRFRRARSFKVYLTNPSMRAALFAPVNADAPELGALAETAVLSQYFHDKSADLFYSRWKKGEVDLIRLDAAQRPIWAVEVKWSDRFPSRPGDLHALIDFCRRNGLPQGWATTRTIRRTVAQGDMAIQFVPTSELCYTVGHNIIHGRGKAGSDAF
jgi:predicted AAA+ superfamily ATPase